MKTHKLLVLLLCLLFAHKTYSQKIGGGELNPGIYTNEKSIEEFQDLKFGLSIHWGPNVIAGQEISWSRGKETPQTEYDNFYKQFNPTKFNADEWVDLMTDFGMKYVIITTKHHDGFSMWHSDYSDYDIAATPFQRDILRELSDACQKKGIIFGTYYSTLDWYHPDYQPYGHGGPGNMFPRYKDTPNQNRYWIYAKNQLRELVTKYNSKIIQFDGDWDSTWTHQIGSDFYLYLRKIKDEVIVNSRTDIGRRPPPPYNENESWRADIFAGDFEERERIVGYKPKVNSRAPYPWQAWVTVDKTQWSWKPDPKLLSASEIITDLIKTVGEGGNYLINIGPKPDGTFEPVIVANMKEVGKWVKGHAESIYGTRAGDFFEEGKFTSTKKGNANYLFVYNTSLKEVSLNGSHKKLISIKDEAGKPVRFKQVADKISFKISYIKVGVPSVYALSF
ncbi:MAG TPA: alpha-L-fucosidase [Pedobacter sp.]|jgi:alpha-L-fucosidase